MVLLARFRSKEAPGAVDPTASTIIPEQGQRRARSEVAPVVPAEPPRGEFTFSFRGYPLILEGTLRINLGTGISVHKGVLQTSEGEKPVVIKEFSLQKAEDWQEAMRRIQREYFLGILMHGHGLGPEMYGIQSYGEVAHLVMGYIDGTPLDALHGQQMEYTDVIDLAQRVGETLQLLHDPDPLSPDTYLLGPLFPAQGDSALQVLEVRHADIKPSNILRRRRGEFFVIDWGISESSRIGNTDIFGSFGYFAPEQLLFSHDAKIGAATDMYAFSVVMWEMLTGMEVERLLNLHGIDGDNLNNNMVRAYATCVNSTRYTEEMMTILDKKRPDIPQSLRHLVEDGLQRDPNRRPTVSQMLDTLPRITQDVIPLHPTISLTVLPEAE